MQIYPRSIAALTADALYLVAATIATAGRVTAAPVERAADQLKTYALAGRIW